MCVSVPTVTGIPTEQVRRLAYRHGRHTELVIICHALASHETPASPASSSAQPGSAPPGAAPPGISDASSARSRASSTWPAPDPKASSTRTFIGGRFPRTTILKTRQATLTVTVSSMSDSEPCVDGTDHHARIPASSSFEPMCRMSYPRDRAGDSEASSVPVTQARAELRNLSLRSVPSW